MKPYQKVQVWIAAKVSPQKPIELLLFKVIEKRGGGWHPVTGSVEKEDATLFDAAKRETLEETGIESGRRIDLDYSFEFTGRWGKASEHAFGLILPKKIDKIKLDPHEHLSCKWVSYDEAIQQIQFQNQKRALEKFSCYGLA